MSGQTIIIKKKKVVAKGGHHGGAWKVAYADFVTAMMAFFLLMWLLNATTEQQRKGIADYFDPSIPISPMSGGGSDMLMGDDVLSSQTMAASRPSEPADMRSAKSIEQALNAAISRTGASIDGERLRVTEVEEGTLIELIEGEKRALFTTGSAAPSGDLAALLSAVSDVINASGADVKITGHTDGHQYGTDNYTNWELSADRANTARRLLLAGGVPAHAVVEVSGKADRVPLADDRWGAANRRIAITLLAEEGAPTTPAMNRRSVVEENSLRKRHLR